MKGIQTKALFRGFIILAVLLSILGAAIDLMVPGIVPAELAAAYASVSTIEDATLITLAGLGVIALVLAIAGIVALIGLYLFRSWGRRLSLWVTVLSVLIYPALGPAVYSGWALMLTTVSIMLWGAVLAMAYFSELSARFSQ